MKPVKSRRAGKMVKRKKRKPATEKQKKNLLRWKSELRGA